jgi:hypothetical protein
VCICVGQEEITRKLLYDYRAVTQLDRETQARRMPAGMIAKTRTC